MLVKPSHEVSRVHSQDAVPSAAPKADELRVFFLARDKSLKVQWMGRCDRYRSYCQPLFPVLPLVIVTNCQ